MSNFDQHSSTSFTTNVNLTHIRGCDLANLDKLSVKHILDVFATLLATRHSEFQPSFTRGN